MRIFPSQSDTPKERPARGLDVLGPDVGSVDRRLEPSADLNTLKLGQNGADLIALRETLADPHASRYGKSKAITLLAKDPTGRGLLLDTLMGVFEGVGIREREKAARALHKASPEEFLRALSELPADCSGRIFGTRALVGHEIRQSELRYLVNSVAPEADELAVAALQAIRTGKDRQSSPFVFSTLCAEATIRLLRYAEKRGLAYDSGEAPTIDDAPHERISPTSVPYSELRAGLKGAIEALSDGQDRVLASAVRNGRSTESCVLPLEILKERNSPEIEPLVREMVRDGHIPVHVSNSLLNLRIKLPDLGEDIRALLARNPWSSFEKALGTLGVPVPAFLRPESRSPNVRALSRLLAFSVAPFDSADFF